MLMHDFDSYDGPIQVRFRFGTLEFEVSIARLGEGP